MPTIDDGKTTIRYQLTTIPNIHYVKIYLDHLNGIHVTASDSRDRTHIESFLQKKSDWIRQKWQSHHESLYRIDNLTLDNDQRIPYLGRSYALRFKESDNSETNFSFSKGKFWFSYPVTMHETERLHKMHELIRGWLYNKANEKFSQNPAYDIVIEDDQTRLGTVREKQIFLNWRLVQQSKQKINETIEDLIEGKSY